MGQPYLDQVAFRWRDDDALAGTWLEAELDNLSNAWSYLDTNIRLRIQWENSGGKDVASQTWQLQYSTNGTDYNNVTASSSVVRSYTSSYFSDQDSSTKQLTTSALTLDWAEMDSTGVSAAHTGPQNRCFEMEACFQFRSADISDGNTVYLRMIATTDGAFDDYTGAIATTAFNAPTGSITQKAFRVRYDLDALNSEGSGWIGALNTDVEVNSDTRFRIRYTLEEATGTQKAITNLKLQYNYESGGWVDATYQTWRSEASNPLLFITESDNYTDGAATSNLLTGDSSETFTAGTGETNTTIAGVDLQSEHTEIEICLVIRKFYANAGHNSDGDTVQFRLVESDGTLLDGYTNTPTITLNHATGHIGGTYTESPRKIGPWCDTNGNLYGFIESDEVTGTIMALKSTDGGDSWLEVDGANRPSIGDFESGDQQQDGDTIWILHNANGQLRLYSFHTSDHATLSDQWDVNEQITTFSQPANNGCALAVLSDGRIRAFWYETVTTQHVRYNTRSSGGSWGTEDTVDNNGNDYYHPWVVIGASDKVHVFYKDNTTGTVYHNSINSSNSWSGREVVESDALSGATPLNPIAGAVYWNNGSNNKVMALVQDDSDELLYSVVITDDGSPETRKSASDSTVIYDAGGSRLPCATLVVDPATDIAYMLYADQTGNDIYIDSATDDGGWGTDSLEWSEDNTDWIRGNVFTHSAGNGGAKVIGLFVDLGSGGGTGFINYREIVIISGSIGSVTADAAIKKGMSGSVTADAAIKKGMSGSVTADAHIVYEISDSVTANAFIEPSWNAWSATWSNPVSSGVSDSITADAAIKKAISSSVTANATIKTSESDSISADAIIKKQQSSSVTADATIEKGQSGSVAADATIEQSQSDSVTADSIIKRFESSSITASATIEVSISDSITSDAIIETSVSDSIAVDATIKSPQSDSITANAWIIIQKSGSVTANATIESSQSGSFTADAYIAGTITGDFTADAVIKTSESGSITANAVIERSFSSSINANAVILRSISDSIVADATIKKSQPGSFTTDATIERSESDSVNADAVIERTESQSVTADAAIERSQSDFITAYSIIEKQIEQSVTADAAIERTELQSIIVDAVIEKVQLGSITADAYIAVGAVEGSITADATIERSESGSVTADSTIEKSQSNSITADANITTGGAGSITADATIERGVSDSITTDAVIEVQESSSITADAAIESSITDAITADATIKKQFQQSVTADAAIEKPSSDSITADATISCVGKPSWVSPPNMSSIGETPTLVFTIPNSPFSMHFRLELDTANTFDTGNYRSVETWVSTTGWEYWDGDSWEPFPSGGVPNTYSGNNCRYTVQSALSPGTWYRRVTGGKA